MKRVLVLIILLAAAPFAFAQDYLYRASMVQAAPGKLLEVIDQYKQIQRDMPASGDEPFLWFRHSQGYRWDLLLLFPMRSYAEYYSPARITKREKLTTALRGLQPSIAWQEDVFVYGPSPDELHKSFDSSGLFHLEIFQALPGMLPDLHKEREMENAYAAALGEPTNFIFTRDAGASWNLFTIGCFRNLRHYAESEIVPKDKQEQAAKAAGFASPGEIGAYLRRFIAVHHDTLGVAIR